MQWKSYWKAYLALLVVYLVWGTTIGSIHLGVESIPWVMLPCLRFLTGGILLIALSLFRGERLPAFNEILSQALAGILLFVGGNTIVCWAVGHIPTGIGGLVVATTPFFMIALSRLIPPRESVSKAVIIGMLISFAGMLILLSPHLTQASRTPAFFWWGIGAMLLNTLFWALGSIYVRKRKPPTSSLSMGVGLQNVIAGLVLLPICLLTSPPLHTIHASMLSIGALLYLIFFGTMLAAPCYIYVLRRLPVSISSTFAYVTPVITVLFGYCALGETLSHPMLLGMSVILAGVVVVQCLGQKPTALATQEGAAAYENEETSARSSALDTESVYTPTGTISVASRR